MKIKVNEQLAPNHPGRPTLCPVQLKELRTIGLNAIALLPGRFARKMTIRARSSISWPHYNFIPDYIKYYFMFKSYVLCFVNRVRDVLLLLK